jgi:LysM repeat protein
MSATYGYNFYFSDGGDVLTFPITPGELTIKVGSNNKVVTLISEGDINILKSPSLTEIEFEARFPMRKYPYSREYSAFQNYFDKFKDLKENKKPFRFIVAREMMKGGRTWDTNILVALEEFEINEDADEGDDVLITFNLKQYKEYGVKQLPASSIKTTTSTSSITRPNTNAPSSNNKSSSYTIKNGDCLWNIAKKFYGDGSKWTKIYNANKSAIEADAKKHGKSSSSNGHWVWAGLKLTIPAK